MIAEDHHHQIYKAAHAKGLGDDMDAGDYTLFVVGLSKHIVEEDLLEYFGILSAQIRRDPVTHCSCGYGVVNFPSRYNAYPFNGMKHRIKDCWVTAWLATPAGSHSMVQRPVKSGDDKENDDKIDSSYYPLIPGHGMIYVGGFSSLIEYVDESIIFRYFSTYGHVDAVELPRLGQTDRDHPEIRVRLSCGWALVRFTNPNDADEATATSGHSIDGVHLIVHPFDGRLLHEVTGYQEDPDIIKQRLSKALAEETMIFLVGLEHYIVEKDVYDYFGMYGVVNLVHIRRDPETKWPCGYAMVDCRLFSAACLSSLINRKHVIKNCIVTALLSAPTDVKRPLPALSLSYAAKQQRKYKTYSLSSPAKLLHTGRDTIYIGGFSALCEHVDESTIFQYFSKYGLVAAVELPRPYADSYLSCKWALVRFVDHDAADAAVKDCPHSICGVLVTVHLTDGRLLQELKEDCGIATKFISNSLVASEGLPAGMVVCNDTIFLVGLADLIVEKDIFYYFVDYGVDWVRIIRNPVTGHSCGYAFIRTRIFNVPLLINRKYVIKDCPVTALSAAPVDLKSLDAKTIPNLYPLERMEERMIAKCKDYPLFSPLRILPGRGTIYVGGFSTLFGQVDKYTISDYFSKYGHVEAVDLPRCKAFSEDPKRIVNNLKGICNRAFVCFSHHTVADEVVKVSNPKSICNWALVRFSRHTVADEVVKASPHYINGVTVTVHLTDGRLLPYEVGEPMMMGVGTDS